MASPNCRVSGKSVPNTTLLHRKRGKGILVDTASLPSATPEHDDPRQWLPHPTGLAIDVELDPHLIRCVFLHVLLTGI